MCHLELMSYAIDYICLMQLIRHISTPAAMLTLLRRDAHCCDAPRCQPLTPHYELTLRDAIYIYYAIVD